MIAAACADNRMGMMFAGRRQSRDRAVIKRIIERAAGKTIWTAPYSLPLFAGFPDAAVQADDAFFRLAGPFDICFIEQGGEEAFRTAHEIWLYRWNRDYPGDVFFPVDLRQWRRRAAAEFPGYSHPVITEEIYKR